MIEARLFNYLTNHAGLSALIGTRLYPTLIPINAEHPAIAYQLLPSEGEGETHQGGDGMFYYEYQFSIQDADKDGHDGHIGAIEVEEQLKAALQAWQGVSGDYFIVRTHCSLTADSTPTESRIFTRRVQFEIQFYKRS